MVRVIIIKFQLADMSRKPKESPLRKKEKTPLVVVTQPA
jgi:hypothetical protein